MSDTWIGIRNGLLVTASCFFVYSAYDRWVNDDKAGGQVKLAIFAVEITWAILLTIAIEIRRASREASQ